MVDARVEQGELSWRLHSGLHRVLLGLAGRMPDEWLTLVRGMLAHGEVFGVPRMVSAGSVEAGVSLTIGEVALLREAELAFFGDPDPVGVDLVTIADATPPTGHRFFPVPAEVLASDAARIPPRLDLTGGPSWNLWDLPPRLTHLDDMAMALADASDQGLVTVLPMNEDVLSVSRAWRFPGEGLLDDGVRVVLVEVAEFSAAYDLTGEVQRDLAQDGVIDPQVEVFWSGMELPPYHRAALAGSALLWRRPA